MNAPRHGLGSEKIRRSAFKVAIPKSVSEDTALIAIRYNGIHPMIGFRDGRMFNVVFIDHKLEVYEH